jgi:hypothetical protein
MTFGRPASIPDDYIRLELPKVLDDDLCSMNQESVGVNSVLFFNATMSVTPPNSVLFNLFFYIIIINIKIFL